MSPSIDPFTAIAPFYDLDFEDYDDDVSFYRSLAEYHGDGVLEFGCGTGRVAVPLAEAGLHVTGVDINAAMLAVARGRLRPPGRARGAPTGGLTLRRGDMRTVDVKRRFAVVSVPLGGLQHLARSEDVAAAIANVARHLAPEGVAALDVEAPHRDDFDPTPQPLVEHWTKPWGNGGQVSKIVAIEAHPAEGYKEITWHFDVATRTGALRRVTAMFDFRTITLPELALAARLAGLRVVAAFGDYAFTPYDDFSERLVVLLQHADAPPPPYGFVVTP
ncbi:MAG: class I SAM-dependent methyltransferase [Dehalococcoidia bacterium]|nr:class I SAM-dependent methyltransferase [Dehalococcoidia bacterium]